MADLDAWDAIRVSAGQLLGLVRLVVSDAGVLDLSDELALGFDATGDGLPDDRGSVVEASALGRAAGRGPLDQEAGAGDHGGAVLEVP